MSGVGLDAPPRERPVEVGERERAVDGDERVGDLRARVEPEAEVAGAGVERELRRVEPDAVEPERERLREDERAELQRLPEVERVAERAEVAVRYGRLRERGHAHESEEEREESAEHRSFAAAGPGADSGSGE